ncbi:MAG: purine-nucleoside phosphorylase [Hyphomicrobiales bacterium]|nr:purine-nucleoside phosphorylase [Hyphomicrobiales bacterium]MDE2017332.1 purine-nucleoside phosphorylase [Hyphomicrobiales bacterium]
MTDAAISRALAALAAKGVTDPIHALIVLGTGLSAFADGLEGATAVPYADLPGFPAAGVSGHAGRFVVGVAEGLRVAVMQGRAHYYETGDAAAMAVPLGLAKSLGAREAILTNASGSCDPALRPGSIALLSDHVNFSGRNPLIGAAGDDRFVPMDDAYDARLRERMARASKACGVPAREAVYMWFSGPSFETKAEVRAARVLGADLVGMSTAPETILARRIGLRVVALSMVTNFASGVSGGAPTHAETKIVAAEGAASMRRLLSAYLDLSRREEGRP